MTDIISKLTEAKNKGAFLELIVEDIFNDQGFINVRRQKSGSQYGYDVIGYKEDQCWKAECKNLNTEAKISDIAPKLIWHIDSVSIDRFVVVSLNGISNDLYRLLELKLFAFPVEIWCDEYLEKLVCDSPKALERLGISRPNKSKSHKARPLIFSASELKFNVVYSKVLPFSYDYFKLNGKVFKAYSENDFRLTASISNKTNRTFTIQQIVVRTLHYMNTENLRVLRQSKQKGLIEPIKLTFTPKQYLGGEVELNQEKLIQVKKHSDEYIEFKLSQKCLAGYYELIFEINCVDGDKTFSLFSPIFQLHKKGLKCDLVNLSIVGKYYDTPVEDILELDDRRWQIVKKTYPNHIKYLGPTMNDVVQGISISPTWSVNLIKGKKNKIDGVYHLDIKSNRKSKLLIDLEIPIKEKIFTQEEAFRKVLGQDN